MRKLALSLITATCLLAGCASGPHQLHRTVDDWDQDIYIKSPWLNGALHFIPVIPFARWAAMVGDFFVTDAYAFWFKDAWDGKGTGFKHFDPAATDGQMHSLLLDTGTFLEIK